MQGRRLDDFLEALQRHSPAGLNATLPTFFEVARTLGLYLDLDSWAQLREDLLLNKQLLERLFGQPSFDGPRAFFGFAAADRFAERLCNFASAVPLALPQLSGSPSRSHFLEPATPGRYDQKLQGRVSTFADL